MVTERASDRFHPLLRHQIVNTLGWRDLRPLQESSAEAILAGSHALVLAPTAGGKTEAAVLPCLSRLLEEEWEGTSVLYLCPLKALLNNLHERLSQYFGMVGHKVGLWHGDVATNVRRRIENERPACLMTTPESLEVMLTSAREEPKHLLRGVRLVVIDEIHAFAGDYRGVHLLAVLERVGELAGREIQRVGLSATVGNPDQLLEWLAGHCAGTRRIVQLESPASQETDVALDYVGTLENAATVITRLHQGEKRLVFCDSRRRVEELARYLVAGGVTTYVSHSSLSAEKRREAEAAFRDEQDCVIVATSTLELGIDVGDLDRVIQIDAPAKVASFLQRLGRTGRRPGSVRNCLFLATRSDALLHAAALISLWEEGYVEPIRPPCDPFHLFAQQLLALTLQKGRLPADGWRNSVGRLPVFGQMQEQDRQKIFEHLINNKFLSWDGVWLSMGEQAEEDFGRRHFLELVSVFTSSPLFHVFYGKQSIGTLDWLGLAFPAEGRRHPIILAGRNWDIEEIDWNKRTVFVSPSEERGKVRWEGKSNDLSFAVARKIHALLSDDGMSTRWTHRAAGQMEEQRREMADAVDEIGRLFIDSVKGRVRWCNFAGGILNQLFATALKGGVEIEAGWSNFELTFPESCDLQEVSGAIRRMLSAEDILSQVPLPDDLVDELKFSKCVPRELAQRAILGRLDLTPVTSDLLHHNRTEPT